MSGKIIRLTGLAVLIIVFLLAAVPAVSATVVYYSQEEPVISPEGLKITSYKISGELPELFTGDEITALYMLQYEPTDYNQLVIDQPGGLFFDLTDPHGYTVRLGLNYIGKTLFPGDYVSVKEKFSLDEPGVWKISPAYTIIAGNGMKKISNPKDWQVVEINILGREDPKPDLIIENIKADFDVENDAISRISYTIKNIGKADSNPSITALFVDGKKVDAESDVGYLPSGESVTIFEPVDLMYAGSTSLFEAQADYDKRINESDYENNHYEIIIENPGFEEFFETEGSESVSGVKVASESKASQAVITEYNQCPSQVQNCSDICFICGVVGLLSILLSVLSFALGYFYGLNKNCERQANWMRSKIDFFRCNKDESIKKEKIKDEDVAEEMEKELSKAIDNMENNNKIK